MPIRLPIGYENPALIVSHTAKLHRLRQGGENEAHQESSHARIVATVTVLSVALWRLCRAASIAMNGACAMNRSTERPHL